MTTSPTEPQRQPIEEPWCVTTPKRPTDNHAAGEWLKSVGTALDVLECFAADTELGVSDIARRLGIAKSTAHRLLTLTSGLGGSQMFTFSRRRARMGGTLAAATLIVGAALALGAHPATAATQVVIVAETLTVCADTGDVPTELGPDNASLALAQFDPALGSLTSATLTIDYSATASSQLTSRAIMPVRYRFSSMIDWEFSSQLALGGPWMGTSMTPLSTSGVINPGQTITVGPATQSDVLTVTLPDVTGLDGTGEVTFVATTATYSGVSSTGGSVILEDHTTGRVKACLLYDYVTRGDASISVEKSVSPTTVPAAGGPVTYTYAVHNTGSEPATITAISDDKLTLPAQSTCAVGTVLSVGGSCTFAVTTSLPAGTGGSTLTNTFSVTASNGYISAAPKTATATVTYLTASSPTTATTPTTAPTDPTPPTDPTASSSTSAPTSGGTPTSPTAPSPDPSGTAASTPASTPASTAAAAVPSGTGAGGSGTGQHLAATGLDVWAYVAVGVTGASALALGALMVLLARRRPSGDQ